MSSEEVLKKVLELLQKINEINKSREAISNEKPKRL